MSKNKQKKVRPFLIVELLSSFSKRELANLTDFVSCNYHNTDVHVVGLLEFFKEMIINEDDFDDAAQCAAFRATFPKKAAPKKTLSDKEKSLLRTKTTDLTRLAEMFLAFEELKENAACKTELLYSQLLKKRQFRLFKRNVAKDEKALTAKTAKGVRDYAHQFKMQSKVLVSFRERELLTAEDNLPELIESFDVYYLANRLKLYTTCFSLTQSSAKKSYDIATTEVIQPLLQLPQYDSHPFIQTYQAAINLLEGDTAQLYEKFIGLLDTNETYIAKEDLDTFYKIAINFYTNRIKEGNPAYYQQIFDLFKVMDHKDLLLENDFMPTHKLKNITTVSCKVGEFEWVRKVVETYRPNLEKECAESVYHFNMGLIDFYQNNFKTAFDHFFHVENINQAYTINSRIMTLKCYYELDDEYDERTLRTLLLSERFIQSHKDLITKDKKAYKNFVRILINIYNTRHGAGRLTKEKILRKLEKLEFVSDKKWLLEKINALKE